ncbi:MAG: hypothetical protein CMJ32_11445 [Phycisphaerae bacterium]|nr:hypothetical protein [Phycisphaerae bacterium]
MLGFRTHTSNIGADMFNRSHGRRVLAGMFTVGLCLLSGCHSPQEGRSTPAVNSETREQLDAQRKAMIEVWELVEQTHFDRTFNGHDWDQVKVEAIRESMDATSSEQILTITIGMIRKLGQSHFSIIPASYYELEEPSGSGSDEQVEGKSTEEITAKEDGEGSVGIDARIGPSGIMVVDVTRESSACQAGVRPGMIITSIDGQSMDTFVQDVQERTSSRGIGSLDLYELNSIVTRRLSGPVDSTVELALEDVDGNQQAVELSRQWVPSQMFKFGNLPEIPIQFEAGLLEPDELERIGMDPDTGQRIAMISFSGWFTPIIMPFNKAIDRYRDADGIIIDLRGNPGGIAGLATGIGGHFFEEPINLGTMQSPGGTLNMRVNPRIVSTENELVTPYGGPVAILVDSMSGSTSEMFAGGLQEAGRARVFGQTTAGAVLPAAMNRLSNGDVLLHAIADFKTPGGVRLEGVGTVPDHEIPLDPALYAREQDPTLRAAVDWIILEDTR